MEDKKTYLNCAECKDRSCVNGKDCSAMRIEIKKKYTGEDLKAMKIYADIEAKYYMMMNRLEELMMYAQMMGYKKLGLAFCEALSHEALIITKILSSNFEVVSVCCTVCGINKNELNLPRRTEDALAVESTCNPIGQAEVLNKAGTQLNIILGLSVGHDAIFTKHSKAPVTTLAVKDRVFCHNPLLAIYSPYYLKTRYGIDEHGNKVNKADAQEEEEVKRKYS
jgi:uncharacterized metal-binding protein